MFSCFARFKLHCAIKIFDKDCKFLLDLYLKCAAVTKIKTAQPSIAIEEFQEMNIYTDRERYDIQIIRFLRYFTYFMNVMCTSHTKQEVRS